MMQSAKLSSILSGSPSSKQFGFSCFTTSLVAHMVKNLPAMQETQIRFSMSALQEFYRVNIQDLLRILF